MKLAIHGGKPVVPEGLLKGWPLITGEDKEAVMRVLDRGILWGTEAPEVSALEKEWAEFIGTKYCLATNSGTSALHMAVAAAGIEPGDEAITSAFTFLASASCVLHHNGIPIFVDIDPKTFCIDVNKIEEKITEKTKIIIPVHINGLPCDMDEIMKIAEKHNLIVIEDACQSHGAEYKGKRVGSIGHLSAFSLQTTKNLCGGEGGLLNTSNEEYKEKARMVRVFGEVMKSDGERTYNAYGMGWMYRTQEMCAAFTRSRLKRLVSENIIRQKNAQYLTEKLRNIKGIGVPYIPEDRTSVYHFYRFKLIPEDLGLEISPLKFRKKVEKALSAEGVKVSPWQNMPIPGQTLFKVKEGYGKGCPWSCHYSRKNIVYRSEDYPETEKLLNSSLIIHYAIYPPNGEEILNYYVDSFYKIFDNIDELLQIEV